MSIGSKINSFRDNTKEWMKLVLMGLLIFVSILGILWMGLSIFANITENNLTKTPEAPSISKAQYEFKINTTGEVLLSQDFDSDASQGYDIFTLHGFYRIVDNKWKFQDKDLSLNEKYWGKIDFRRRE